MTLPINSFRSNQIRALSLDWAGTMVDYGSRAPVAAFIAALAKQQITVTAQQAREPMGKAKRDHIASILAMPAIAAQWRERHGRDSNDGDIDRIYVDFQTLQFECLEECSHLIPGCAQVINDCRARGMKIGSSTGYTRAMMDVVMAQARREGYYADAMFCADDVPKGRPAPWLIFECMRKLEVYPPSSVVTVDDTTVGVEAGRNAGTWSVGVALTGNEMGLSEAEIAQLSPQDLSHRLARARLRLLEAGAHRVIDSVAQLPAVITEFESRLAAGGRP